MQKTRRENDEEEVIESVYVKWHKWRKVRNDIQHEQSVSPLLSLVLKHVCDSLINDTDAYDTPTSNEGNTTNNQQQPLLPLSQRLPPELCGRIIQE